MRKYVPEFAICLLISVISCLAYSGEFAPLIETGPKIVKIMLVFIMINSGLLAMFFMIKAINYQAPNKNEG